MLKLFGITLSATGFTMLVMSHGWAWGAMVWFVCAYIGATAALLLKRGW